MGPVLMGDLPAYGEVIERSSTADGYIETLLVLDGYIEITLGRFPDAQARADFLGKFHPEMEAEIIEDDDLLAGCEAVHTRYMAVKDDDLGLAESYCFETDTDFYLFHVFANGVDWADYQFFREADENHFLAIVDDWAQSLEIFRP